MPVTRTYTPLSQVVSPQGHKMVIGKCGGMLENKMQCWRAGDVQVVQTETIPVDNNMGVDTKVITYQLCNMHARLQYEDDKKREAGITEVVIPASVSVTIPDSKVQPEIPVSAQETGKVVEPAVEKPILGPKPTEPPATQS